MVESLKQSGIQRLRCKFKKITHSLECCWVLEDNDHEQRIESVKDITTQLQLKKEYKDGYINHSTSLVKKVTNSKKPEYETRDKFDDLDIDVLPY